MCAALLTGLLVAAIEVREPENENEGVSAALTATEPTDNGMAVGEVGTKFYRKHIVETKRRCMIKVSGYTGVLSK